ncbi:MAG TPA: benzoate-CoA ligase family protein [Vicinamibacterales bacterium]|jgi:benzoate-CoA ligase|nr:benzoate-CoA ligase family protein [Vicinamibacterales bacterium]
MNAAAEFVDDNVRAGRGANVAVIDGVTGATLTYAQVLALVNRAGNALRDLGVGRGERVMLLLPDGAPFIAGFFGAIKIGSVALPVNTLLKPHDYEYLLNDSNARVLIVHESLAGSIDPIRDRVKDLKHVVVVGSGRPSDLRFDDWCAGASEDLDAVEMDRDDQAFWLYSSGTTGFPKGAMHLQHDMRCTADWVGRGVFGISERDRTFSVAKLFFAYGLGNALYFPFSVGASTILYPAKPEPETCFKIIERHRPTIFYAVPTAYAAMLSAAERSDRTYDLSSLRVCSSAGEPLPAALYERWKARFGVEIVDGIGSTEALHTFISNRPGRARPGSSGELVHGYDARIVDGDGRDVPQGEIGDLLIKGDSICAGYWNQPEKTAATIVGDWIRTGDKYSRDADGYFWYHGRSDDMLKSGGQWVSPAEVEAALVAHDAVLECGVVGREDAAGLVKPLAFVVLKTGRTASPELADELKQFVKTRIAVYKCPRWIAFAGELPKTATGKIQRYKLRELAAER